MFYSLSLYSLYFSSISRELATIYVVLFVFLFIVYQMMCMMCIMCGYHKHFL